MVFLSCLLISTHEKLTKRAVNYFRKSTKAGFKNILSLFQSNQLILVTMFPQVELVQLVIDGVNYLIECEKRLEKGQDIKIPSPIPQFRK